MSRRASSLNVIDSGLSREIGSHFDDVKKVANNIDAVVEVAATDLEGLTAALVEAKDFTGITVVTGDTPDWDATNKVLTVPTLKGDTGEDAPVIVGVNKTGSVGRVDTYTISMDDGSSYTFEITNGANGYTPVKGVDYVDGKSNYQLWLDAGNVGTLGDFLVSIKGAPGTPGNKGDKGDKGDTGDDLTIEQIVYNGNGTFTWNFSDETTYTTPDLRGPRGFTGDKGDKGDQGVSVHHIKFTSTTEVHGFPAKAGETDVYTLYGDANETIVLGWFQMTNGISGVYEFDRLARDKVNRIGYPDTLLTTDSQTILDAINELDEDKIDVTGGTITGDLTIGGDLTVSGTTVTVDAETVLVKDNLLVINNGEVGAGVTNVVAGIEVDRGTADSYQFLFDETDDSFKVGEVGDLQKVATREDSPLDTGVATWSATESKFVTSRDLGVDNIVVTGTVDGRDVSVDGLKLDTIEEGATADQIAAEVPYDGTASGIVATDVQGAIDSLDGRVDTLESKTVDLAYTVNYVSGTITNTGGDGVVIPSATTTEAGLLSAADKTKLDSTETAAELDLRDVDNRNVDNHTSGVINSLYTQLEKAFLDVDTILTTGAFTLPTAVNELDEEVSVNRQNIQVIVDAMAGLSSASASFGASGVAIDIPTNGTLVQVSSYDIKLDSNDASILELNASTGEFTFKRAGKYSFIANVYAKAVNKDPTITPSIVLESPTAGVIYDDTFGLVKVKKDGITFPMTILFEITQAMIDTYGDITAFMEMGHVETIPADQQVRVIGFDAVLSTMSSVHTGFADHSQLTGTADADSHPASAIKYDNDKTVEQAIENIDLVTGTTGTSKRFDKRLAALDIIDMEYVDGDLVTVRYEGDDDSTVYYRDVLSYVSGNLAEVKHYYGTSDLVTESASTTLIYDLDDNLVSSAYSEV